MSVVFDDRPCQLGEGPLWHPERGQLFWFDILGKRLLSRVGDRQLQWNFDEHVSAAGWVDRDTLLVASESGLWRFAISTGQRSLVVALEADNPLTRSNDGRADPWGGFWIGTMGKSAEADAGAIYRFFRGELRLLVPGITISNAICFAPDRTCAYFCDTVKHMVMQQPLDPDEGWPAGKPRVFLDLRDDALNPDGAVVDVDGNIWIAQWGASRVAVHDASGRLVKTVEFPALHTSCPAFGGDEVTTLFCTTARSDLSGDVLKQEPRNGMTFMHTNAGHGQMEHRVML